MIQMRFYSGQGLGNQLWVYAAGRALAEYHQTTFSVIDKELFKGSTFLDIDACAGSEATEHESDQQGTESRAIFKERLFYDKELRYYASTYDKRVEIISGSTIIEGLYQSEKYLFSNLSRLRNWIRLKEEYMARSKYYNDKCIINVRGGEYKRHGFLILPKSYWLNAINNMNRAFGIKDFLIVTDDKPYASRLLPGIPVLDGSIGDCYSALYGAGYLIVSNSSFSYFPIKTRIDKPPVIAPFLWSRPFNKEQRWASPANFYKDWTWQTIDGVLVNEDICQKIVDKTTLYYANSLNISTTDEALRTNYGWPRYIPKKIRNITKKCLSALFPMRIG